MKYNKIIIPKLECWEGCQLLTNNLDNFKKFISCRSYDIKITIQEIKGMTVPIKICFKWNPYRDDYGDSVEVSLNSWFMYNLDDLRYFKVITPEEIEDSWYYYEIGN